MDLTRTIYHLRSIATHCTALAAELEKIRPAQAAAAVQEPVDIFAALPETTDAPAEDSPVEAVSVADKPVIRRKWTNRRHVAYTPEETAFIMKCRETGDDNRTIADKLERRFGFRVSPKAVYHHIAKIEGREQ